MMGSIASPSFVLAALPVSCISPSFISSSSKPEIQSDSSGPVSRCHLLTTDHHNTARQSNALSTCSDNYADVPTPLRSRSPVRLSNPLHLPLLRLQLLLLGYELPLLALPVILSLLQCKPAGSSRLSWRDTLEEFFRPVLSSTGSCVGVGLLGAVNDDMAEGKCDGARNESERNAYEDRTLQVDRYKDISISCRRWKRVLQVASWLPIKFETLPNKRKSWARLGQTAASPRSKRRIFRAFSLLSYALIALSNI